MVTILLPIEAAPWEIFFLLFFGFRGSAHWYPGSIADALTLPRHRGTIL